MPISPKPISQWGNVDAGPLGKRMIQLLERYPKAGEVYITSAMDGDHGGSSHHYGLTYEGSRTAAIDIGAGGQGAGSAKMRDIARWLYENFADYTVELIHTSPFSDDDGFYVKNRVRYPGGGVYGQETVNAHRDHVHWATSDDLMTSIEQFCAERPLEPVTRGFEPAAPAEFGVPLSASEQRELLGLLRELVPLGRRLGQLLARSGQDEAVRRSRGLDSAPEALRAREPINPGPPVNDARKIRDVTGVGLTDRFGMTATDLGVMTRTRSGRLLAIFGDTFQGERPGSNDWRAPVGLISDTKNLDDGIVWTQAAGPEPSYARQLWYYPHVLPGGQRTTVLPSDVMTIGETVYLHTTAHFPFGNVGFGEIWKSTDEGRVWTLHGPRLDTSLHGELAQLWTWDLGDDGYVYILSTGFHVERNQPVILRRVDKNRIDDPGAYEGWGWGRDSRGNWGWAWGREPSTVLDGGYGEMSLRRIDGQWVLVAFNAGACRLDVRVFPDFENCDLRRWPTSSPIVSCDWGCECDGCGPRVCSVAQLYGPSIIPGSRPGSGFHIMLSQWKNPPDNGLPYHAMQFKIPVPSLGGVRDLQARPWSAPPEAIAAEARGKERAGQKSAGKRSAGKGSAGRGSAGKGSAGKQRR